MWFLSKLKSGKWYECGDSISVNYVGDGMLNIKYKGSTVKMDVPYFVSYEWYKAYMQEQEILHYQHQQQYGGVDGPGYQEQQEQDFSRVTDEQLEMLLSDLINGENYMGCIRVRNEIEKRKKKN